MNTLKISNTTGLLAHDCGQCLEDLKVLEAARLSKRSAMVVDRLMVRLAYMQRQLNEINGELSAGIEQAIKKHNEG